MNIFVVVAVLIAFPTITVPAYSRSAFIWGANGHPGGGGPYSDLEAQCATLEERGLRSYRFDVKLTTGNHSAAVDLQNLVTLAKKYKVILHPLLQVPFTWGDATDGGRYRNTEAGLEAQGYERVYSFVLQFAKQIRDWELENELSLIKGFKSGDGQSAGDYATPLASQWAAVLRGMSKAIVAVRAQTGQPLRTVVDTSYLDFGLVPFLETQGVSVDKLAYHYYYGAGTDPHKVGAPNGKAVNIFAELQKIGKPIIVNEFNAAEVSSPARGKPYDDALALVRLKRHIEQLLNRNEANIEGVEYYELYDEPRKSLVESNFGLMKDARTPKTQMLLLAAYACGHISGAERATLLSKRLFTTTDLSSRLVSCTAATSSKKLRELRPGN